VNTGDPMPDPVSQTLSHGPRRYCRIPRGSQRCAGDSDCVTLVSSQARAVTPIDPGRASTVKDHKRSWDVMQKVLLAAGFARQTGTRRWRTRCLLTPLPPSSLIATSAGPSPTGSSSSRSDCPGIRRGSRHRGSRHRGSRRGQRRSPPPWARWSSVPPPARQGPLVPRR
jgi:hypothetical protein